jgi:hypothetical protein
MPERTFTVMAQEETDKIQMELYNNHQKKRGCVTGRHERAGTEHRSHVLVMQEADRALKCYAPVSSAVSAGKTDMQISSSHV